MYEAVVMGVSAGGVDALKTVLPALPEDFPLPIAIVQHRDAHSDGYIAEYLNRISALTVKEAEDKEPLRPGYVYLAPGGYHLLIEPDGSFSLSVDPRVNYSCPSVDVLFESAADVYGARVIGVVMTGANEDGAKGLKAIKARGGLALVQEPSTAQVSTMPKAALAATAVDYVVALPALAPLLLELAQPRRKAHGTGD
jgi:two-component system chemotaxis response regulator CheB